MSRKPRAMTSAPSGEVSGRSRGTGPSASPVSTSHTCARPPPGDDVTSRVPSRSRAIPWYRSPSSSSCSPNRVTSQPVPTSNTLNDPHVATANRLPSSEKPAATTRRSTASGQPACDVTERRRSGTSSRRCSPSAVTTSTSPSGSCPSPVARSMHRPSVVIACRVPSGFHRRAVTVPLTVPTGVGASTGSRRYSVIPCASSSTARRAEVAKARKELDGMPDQLAAAPSSSANADASGSWTWSSTVPAITSMATTDPSTRCASNRLPSRASASERAADPIGTSRRTVPASPSTTTTRQSTPAASRTPTGPSPTVSPLRGRPSIQTSRSSSLRWPRPARRPGCCGSRTPTPSRSVDHAVAG